MKKKMERLDGKLFQPLNPNQMRSATAAFTTQTATTIFETANPNPDFSRDGDHE